jgi:ABC-type transport system substrate-binding protein
MKSIVLSLILLFTACNSSDEKAASQSNSDTFVRHFTTEPTTLNPLSSTDGYSTEVHFYAMDALTTLDVDTYEVKPALAESWETSKDGLTISFNLRKGVKWHDGKPFTADDVKFTFDAIRDPSNKYETAPKKPYFENFKEAIVENPHRITFKIKTKYFGNFNVVSQYFLKIVPRHLYENPTKEQKKELNRTLVGTGPYKFIKWRKGKHIELEKNMQWWGNTVYPKINKINKVKIKFVKEPSVALQRMEKGDMDFMELRSEDYAKKANGGSWGKSVFKVQADNEAPKSYGFIGWNNIHPLFKTRNARHALYSLVDRQKMIDKFTYGLSSLATGPWYHQSPYADSNVKPVDFNPKRAAELLKKEGWTDSDGDQVLDKMINGKKTPFRFTIMNPNQSFSKYLVIFQQDAKKVGIDIEIKVVEWNTFIKLLDEKKFEAVVLSWGGGSIDYDPKQIWHSSSSAVGGSNFISYNNKKVDKLIDTARTELNKKKRIVLMQEVYREIAADMPYAFLFVPKYELYANSKKVKKEKDTYRFDIGRDFWVLQKP